MGAGNDSVTGNASANVINGGGGNDTLIGGAGTDTMTDGNGDDIYRYFSTSESQVGILSLS